MPTEASEWMTNQQWLASQGTDSCISFLKSINPEGLFQVPISKFDTNLKAPEYMGTKFYRLTFHMTLLGGSIVIQGLLSCGTWKDRPGVA